MLKYRVYLFLTILCSLLGGASCNEGPSDLVPSEMTYNYLSLNTSSGNDLIIDTKGRSQYKITTTGNDPYILLKELTYGLDDESVVFTFEYKSGSDIGPLQLFFGEPITEERSVKSDIVPGPGSWETFSIDVKNYLDEFSWGQTGDLLRLDLGSESGVEMEIKNIHFRKRNEEEKARAEEKKANRENDLQLEKSITDYIKTSFGADISSVNVSKHTIIIKGYCPDPKGIFLSEIRPSEDVSTKMEFDPMAEILSPNFTIEVDRFSTGDNLGFDRVLSKWVLVQENGGYSKIISHARYADEIEASENIPVKKVTGKKGLGGFSVSRGFTSDLDDLGISSVTVNITFTQFMCLNGHPNAIEHEYAGKTYYFDREKIEHFDKTMQVAYSKDISVAAIILVNSASQSVDPEIGDLLEHPNYEAEGFFTMPNMTNPESVHCYAAALDFLASRYSRTDHKYGRIHKWIMHNEVDAGLTWTNMGEKPMMVFLDAYMKSMRMCHNIVRSYNGNGEVLASFTHSWTEPVEPRFYGSKKMIQSLLDYSRVEGDFNWGLAYHTYPQDLNEPKTWLDDKALFSENTPLITFKNLEVLNDWVKKPENLYNGEIKRTVWLSENGTNSRTYSKKDLSEQAAGLAYAWKKLDKLDGIDAMQWHNWIDNRGEFGLKIGLRKFPDNEEDPGGRKPVWYVYEAAGTSSEDNVFPKYKTVIGIEEWSEIMFEGAIK
nr:DUF5722 domain-containing protein [Membranihabitans maritimus]